MPRSPEVVVSASGPAAETVLTDEMLARFAKRAPQYDRDNAFFVGRLRRASPGRVSSRRRSCRARRGRPVARGRRQRAAAARLLRRADGARDQHALVLDGQRRRSLARRRPIAALAARGRRGGRGLRRGARRERQRHPCAAVDDEGGARGRRLPVHGPQVVRQPVAGLDLSRAFTASTPPIRRIRRSSTRSCRATPKAIESSQTWDVLGMRATRSDDTILDGVFVPDRYVVRVVPAGAAGIDAFRARASSRGRSSGSATFITASPAARWISRSTR